MNRAFNKTEAEERAYLEDVCAKLRDVLARSFSGHKPRERDQGAQELSPGEFWGGILGTQYLRW